LDRCTQHNENLKQQIDELLLILRQEDQQIY